MKNSSGLNIIKHCLLTAALVLALYTQNFCQENQAASSYSQALLANQRVMQTFDFEEREINFLDLPMYWTKIPPSKGFPHYSEGILNDEFAHSGKYGFKLASEGGSVGFEYHRRRIRAKPGNDFQITGYVHLKDAPTCRAQITCCLTDRNGKVIPGSEHKSELISDAEQTPQGWARLEVYLPGQFPDARFITLSVLLLQQQQWDIDGSFDGRTFKRDINALAWFDDISVYQLPRVKLFTDEPGNLFEPSGTPALNVEVEGISDIDYEVQLQVASSAGKLMHEQAWILSGIEGANQVRTITLPEMSAGFYHATLNIISGGILVAERELNFCKLAALTVPGPVSGTGFGIVSLKPIGALWETTAELTRMANAKLLKIPVWHRKSTDPGAIFSEKDFDRKLIRLQRNNIELIATFSDVPDYLASQMNMGRRSLLDILSQDIQFWQPQVAIVLSQYAHQVPFWQIGKDPTNLDLLQWDPRIRSVAQTMRQEFDKLVTGAVIAAPVNALLEIYQNQVNTNQIALAVPAKIRARQIPEYIEGFRQRGVANIWTTIQPLESDIYSREQILIDLAHRIAFAKTVQPNGIFIEQPWEPKIRNAELAIEPQEILLVFRTLADQLGGAQYMGRFALSDDINALIFDRAGVGSLFLWREESQSTALAELTAFVDIYLGPKPGLMDIMGNRHELPAAAGLSRLTVEQWPFIVTNIHTPLAALRASLKVTPEIIDANITRQNLTINFTNTFDTPISGRLHFGRNSQQQEWEIEPLSGSFALQPGEVFSRDLTIKFPRNELGGKKKLYLDIRIDADRTYTIRAWCPFEIKLQGIDVGIFARRVNGNDLIIQQVVTNYSSETISMIAFADLPDGDRIERMIPNLQPRATTTKSFVLKDAQKWLGRYVRLGLYDPKGTRRINYTIPIN